MSSILVGELKALLDTCEDDWEVVMNIHHRYDIPKESGEKGWLAYINGAHRDPDHRELRLMN